MGMRRDLSESTNEVVYRVEILEGDVVWKLLPRISNRADRGGGNEEGEVGGRKKKQIKLYVTSKSRKNDEQTTTP